MLRVSEPDQIIFWREKIRDIFEKCHVYKYKHRIPESTLWKWKLRECTLKNDIFVLVFVSNSRCGADVAQVGFKVLRIRTPTILSSLLI